MEEALKVSMVTDVGGVNDLSFNQSAWEGLERSKAEFGTDVSYLESKQEADYEVNLETLVDEENDLVWGIGFMMGESLSFQLRITQSKNLRSSICHTVKKLLKT